MIPKMDPKSYKLVPKTFQKPSKIDPKTMQKRYQNETKIGSKNGSKTTPKSTSKSIQNRLQKASQKRLPQRAKKSDTSHAKPPFLKQPVLTLEREARNVGNISRGSLREADRCNRAAEKQLKQDLRNSSYFE